MSKRKKADPNPEEEEEEEEETNIRSKIPQKVYDFHKKTTEVYPERLLDLNQQFLASISTQVKTEPYSVLVGNCLDYVRQYFKYEDDLLQYSPWLATRLKQSRSDIVKCLQETIDVYEALARQDFDRLIEKTNSNSSEVRPTPSTTTASSAPLFNFPKQSETTKATNNDSGFSLAKSTPTTTSSETGFNFAKSTPTTSSGETGFNFPKFTPTTTSSETVPTGGFSFKLPSSSSSTASPEKSATPAPFSFSIPTAGFGTSTFGTSNATDKSALSFATPSKISFAPPPASASSDQGGANEENEDEASEPPEPEKVEHEADAKLTYRCQMGVNKSGKLIKRGRVQVVLKEANDKHQLIVRSDDALGRLYLNILWSKLIELKKNSKKDLTFVCKLNPGMPEVAEGEFVMILFRFDNETERNEAYEKLDKERS